MTELSAAARRTLQVLNESVSVSGELLEGNLFYFHEQPLAIDASPDPLRSVKRQNYRIALEGITSLLEVGFNAGHSALLALDSSSCLRYAGIDIGLHSYSRSCANVLSIAYGDRFDIAFCDSKVGLAEHLLKGSRFDLVHVDGGHDDATAQSDILLALRLGKVVVVDDTNHPPIADFVRRMVREGYATEYDFAGRWVGYDNIAIRSNVIQSEQRLLLQIAVGVHHESLLSLTEAHHRKYASRWRSDYRSDDKIVPQGKRPHWRKVSLVREALAKGYDLVFWLDADSVIVRTDVDIFSYAGPHISICECFDSPTIERHYNTGVILFRNTPMVRKFVSEWDECEDDFVGWADQKGFIRLVSDNSEYRELLTTLPNSFNSVRTHMESYDPIIRSAHGEPDRLALVDKWVIESVEAIESPAEPALRYLTASSPLPSNTQSELSSGTESSHDIRLRGDWA